MSMYKKRLAYLARDYAVREAEVSMETTAQPAQQNQQLSQRTG